MNIYNILGKDAEFLNRIPDKLYHGSPADFEIIKAEIPVVFEKAAEMVNNFYPYMPPFEKMYDFLTSTADDDKYHYAMVGYRIKNTVTEQGTVSRGVCEADENSMLTEIVERTNAAHIRLLAHHAGGERLRLQHPALGSGKFKCQHIHSSFALVPEEYPHPGPYAPGRKSSIRCTKVCNFFLTIG